MDEQQKERIRNRQSYRQFKRLLQFLNREPSKRTVLIAMHNLIDSYHGFGSQRNSDYALESIKLLLADEK
jgi:type II secretory pathway component PulK